MRLHRPPAYITNGKIKMDGKDILSLSEKELQKFRWKKISMVFQSAMNCLNPVVTLEKQFLNFIRPMVLLKIKKNQERWQRSF